MEWLFSVCSAEIFGGSDCFSVMRNCFQPRVSPLPPHLILTERYLFPDLANSGRQADA